MKDNNHAFIFSSYITFSEDGKDEFSLTKVPNKLDYSGYCKNTIIGCLTVIIDKEQVGEFKMPNIKSSHDMALWLLIMKRGFNAYGLNEPLAKYRLVTTSNTAKKYKVIFDVWKVYRDIEKINIFKSSWFFINYILNAILKRL